MGTIMSGEQWLTANESSSDLHTHTHINNTMQHTIQLVNYNAFYKQALNIFICINLKVLYKSLTFHLVYFKTRDAVIHCAVSVDRALGKTNAHIK